MKKLKEESITLTITLNKELALKVEDLLAIGQRFNGKYTKELLFKDAIENLWDIFREIEEAEEEGRLEIEYQN